VSPIASELKHTALESNPEHVSSLVQARVQTPQTQLSPSEHVFSQARRKFVSPPDAGGILFASKQALHAKNNKQIPSLR
jgi:hypothetical protein